MKKDVQTHTSQDYDRKHGDDHIEKNPRAVKDIPAPEDRISDKAAATTEDRRQAARREHTNHFTNRATDAKK